MRTAFAAAAPSYDALTRFFSFGLDGRWRRRCLDACQLRPGHLLLDAATGTGELAIDAARRVSTSGRVIGLDACEGMLLHGRRKAGHAGVRVAWVLGKAESLPFQDERFDCVTVGFALRHVPDLAATLKEMMRVLRPGGRLGIVEFTRPRVPLTRILLLGYLSVVVAPLAGLLSGSWLTYRLARYLPATIGRFVSTEELCHCLERAGVTGLTAQRFMAGLVSVCIGRKGNTHG